MPLTPGTRLGPYEILAPLGAGGMGEVYRAKDSRLDREAAIKVLPAAVAQDRDRLARFEREARVLASLNHPNIAQIYGFEESGDTRALVIELVQGSTLTAPQHLETALRYAAQIAAALEAAHEKGITHRDLKPANIMVTPAGVVKVLDFGLATVPNRDRESSAPASSPTMTLAATQAGMIMGTAAYMSPEQAAGKPVDKRADIWSFGVVLYEMLVGEQLFNGETVSHTLADVLRAPIDFGKLPGETPRAIRDLLRRCLNRDAARRLRDIGDARISLEESLAGSDMETPAAAAPVPPSWLGRLLPAAAVVLAAALAGLAFVHFREQPPAAALMRFQIPAPDYKGPGNARAIGLSISPDGRRLAFAAPGANGQTLIWVRSLDSLENRPLPGTEGASHLFWSPNSSFIAFAAAGTLKKVDASGGPTQAVCDLPGSFRGGTWAPDGTILLSALASPLMRVSEAGGKPVPLAAFPAADPEKAQTASPSFLPDGRHFVYVSRLPPPGDGGIYLGSIDARPGEQAAQPLAPAHFPNTVVYAPSPDPAIGYVLFERDGYLMALPFDIRRLQPAGAAIQVAEGIVFSGTASFAASSTGVLALPTAGRSASADSQLLWFDRNGKEVGRVGPPAAYSNLQISPDGKLLLVDYIVNHAFNNLSSADPARGVFSPVNPGKIQNYAGGAVSPDGRVAFTYGSDIYVRSASGAGTAEPLILSATVKHPNHWSLDGRYIIYDDHTAQQQDLWIVPMAGDRKPVPFLVTPADETDANFSPDTKWIAYSSDESGRREVYVQGFVPDHVPAAGIGKWRISTAGGAKPRWRRDGKEMYYIALDGKLMAVPVTSTASTFAPGVAVSLFQTHTAGFNPYDVAPDGRFLLNTVAEDTDPKPSPITIVLNWTAGLRK